MALGRTLDWRDRKEQVVDEGVGGHGHIWDCGIDTWGLKLDSGSIE